MIKWILILLVVAAIAGLLGFNTISGAALTGAKLLIAIVLILFLSVKLGWIPALGYKGFSYVILPAIVLGTIPLAVIARQTRSAMLEVMGEDYVRTARAKGLSERRVVALHALRNALIPVVTTVGLQVGLLMGGAILTETIFSWPGVGRWMVESIFKRDYSVVQSGLLLIAIIVMVINLVVDILYGAINPRIRAQN